LERLLERLNVCCLIDDGKQCLAPVACQRSDLTLREDSDREAVGVDALAGGLLPLTITPLVDGERPPLVLPAQTQPGIFNLPFVPVCRVGLARAFSVTPPDDLFESLEPFTRLAVPGQGQYLGLTPCSEAQ